MERAVIDVALVESYVRPGRCMCCGSRKLMWPPDQIAEACVAWMREKGKTPRAKDWQLSKPDHPSYTTVERVFGSWNNMLRAAGLFSREHGTHQWTREDVANAMLDHLMRHGVWPKYRDWTSGCPDGSRPNTSTVVAMFGTWGAAKTYAGFDQSAAAIPDAAEPTCTGCGGDLESSNTIGCTPCQDRRRTRASRAAARNGLALGVVESPNPTGDSDAEADGNAVLPGQPVNHVAQAA